MNRINDTTDYSLPKLLDRREDVDAKHARLAELIQETNCEGLLLTQPWNVSWFTSGAVSRGLVAMDDLPFLYILPQQRWILANRCDSRRWFDEEIDQLGFQLKEWDWQGKRDQLGSDLVANRRVITDRPLGVGVDVGPVIDSMRFSLSDYDRVHYQELAKILSHGLEATARNIQPGETEAEIAGHLSHRLIRHGVEVTSLQITADDRIGKYPRGGFRMIPVQERVVLQATIQRRGQYVTASRSVSFVPIASQWQNEFDFACRLTLLAQLATPKNSALQTCLEPCHRYLIKYFPQAEQQWQLFRPALRTGYRAIEAMLSATDRQIIDINHAIIWQTHIGEALVCDTYLCTDSGWDWLTSNENWPYRRYLIQGMSLRQADILFRADLYNSSSLNPNLKTFSSNNSSSHTPHDNNDNLKSNENGIANFH